LLYWDDEAAPESVLQVLHQWRENCPSWNVQLFGKRTAEHFLLERFGSEIRKCFLSCAVPAMRSDFFRVFWALEEGGIYSDVTFLPKSDALFFSDQKNITLARWHHGRIVNGVFFAKKNCQELKLVAYEILMSVSKRADNNIWSAVGPGAWIRALGQEESESIAIVDRSYLFEHHLKMSGYESSTRDTELHWSKVQENISIYKDVKHVD
jgi:hypothetical protein